MVSSAHLFMFAATTFGLVTFYGAYDCNVAMQLRTAINGYVRGSSRSSSILSKANLSEAYENLNLAKSNPICPRLFRGGSKAISVALKDYSNYSPVADELYSMMALDCSKFRHKRAYLTGSVSQEEKSFPIAYSILLYKDVDQFERLLRAIYRPQNIICIHVDRKSELSIHEAVSAIAGCFENVFVVPDPHSVYWGTLSVLEAEKSCMNLLWRKNKEWKYLINLTGQEYPLKTNSEIVKILKAYNGANDIEFHYGNYNKFKTRTAFKCQERKEGEKEPKKIHLSAPPNSMKLAVGSTHIAVTREFVDFALHNKTALDFYEWLKDTCIPDETFFNSLYINPQLGVPGAYNGDPQIYDILNIHYVRYKKWNFKSRPCKGRDIRGVCIQNIYYLPELRSTPEMFVNKFIIDYHPIALRCMEELIYNRTLAEIRGHSRRFKVGHYKAAHFVRFTVNKKNTTLPYVPDENRIKTTTWL